jgi:hypothetical protein
MGSGSGYQLVWKRRRAALAFFRVQSRRNGRFHSMDREATANETKKRK